jgi:hypothetical protein
MTAAASMKLEALEPIQPGHDGDQCVAGSQDRGGSVAIARRCEALQIAVG